MEFLSLDVGCGHSRRRHVKRGKIGVDLKRGLCDIVADACHLPFRSKVFRKIYSVDILEHLKQPIQCLLEIDRVAAENASISITIPAEVNPGKALLKRFIIGFPFSVSSISKKIYEKRRFSISYDGHKSIVVPRHVASVFKIHRVESTNMHPWFVGRKGAFLRKIFSGEPRSDCWIRGWRIQARKE